MNPYIHEGARVRVVNHDNCPWMILNGEEYVVTAVSNCGKFVQTRGDQWFGADRFKPVVRVKMGRRATVFVVTGDTHYGQLDGPGQLLEVDESHVQHCGDLLFFENPVSGGWTPGRLA